MSEAEGERGTLEGGDFQSFLKLLEEGRRRHSIRVLRYCLMENHWHLVL